MQIKKLNMRRIISYATLLVAVVFAACTQEDEFVWDDEVVMTFCPVVDDATSRAEAPVNSSVNTVVCAVFENDRELPNLRDTFDLPYINPGITYSPRLVKGHTYDVVFWAFNRGYYDVRNLQAITLNPDSIYGSRYDAFTKSIQVKASAANDLRQTVLLTRPLAHLSFNVPATYWNAIPEAERPAMMKIEVPQVKSAYDALNGSSAGADATVTYTLKVIGDATADGYKKLTSCFLLASPGGQQVDVTYNIYKENQNTPYVTRLISGVNIRANYTTNINGELLGKN